MGDYKMFRFEHCGFVAVVPCPRCRGEGWLFDDHECGRCSGTGELVFDALWLATLAHNLAIAAFGQRMFELGSEYRMRAMLGLSASEDCCLCENCIGASPRQRMRRRDWEK